MGPSKAMTYHFNWRAAAIIRSCQRSDALSIIKSMSNLYNITIRKYTIWVIFSALHTSVYNSMKTIFTVSSPFQIFCSIVRLNAIFVIYSDFTPPILARWRFQKSESNKRVNSYYLFLPSVFSNPTKAYLSISAGMKMLFHYHLWPHMTAGIWTGNTSYSSLIRNFVRKRVLFVNDAFPLLFHSLFVLNRHNRVKAA